MTSEPPTRLDLRHRWARLYDELAELRDLHNGRGADLEGEGKDAATAFARADELNKVLARMARMEADR